MLHRLYLVGTKDEQNQADGATAIFTGPPQSVALIEAGAGAATKITGLLVGASVPAVWLAVARFWGQQPDDTRRVLRWCAAIVTSAALVGLSHLVSSDLRARGRAAAATIEARARVAEATLRFAARPAARSAAVDGAVVPIPEGVVAEYIAGIDDPNWTVLALKESTNGKDQLFLVRQDNKS
jgi:hypothetical protein